MSTTTQARNTKNQAKATAGSAKATGRSASATAKTASDKAARTTRREADRLERGVVVHGRRVVQAAQAEISAVANQPTRPLYFALGVADRTAAGVRSVPGSVGTAVVEAPRRTRQRLVGVLSAAGDLAERGQRQYGEVAHDGQLLVRSVRRQESTQRAVKFAERAQTRASRSISDAEKAVEAGAEAVGEAAAKLG